MDSVPSQPAEPQCPVTPDDPVSEEAYDAVIGAMDQMIAEAPEPAELPPHTAAERHAILTGLGLDADDPACHARAIAEGLIRTDPPYQPGPWPRPPRDERT